MAGSLLNLDLRNKAKPVAVRGEGVYVFDSTGKRYLDASGGALTVTIGHGVPEIAEAIADQARKLAFVFRAQFTSEPAAELADLLIEEAPSGFSKVLFTSSGSEAVEAAIKIARQYHNERGASSRNNESTSRGA